MMVTAASVGKLLWVLGVVAWYIIRYPFERRAKRVPIVTNRRSRAEALALALALIGLAVLPAIYVASGFPARADYPAHWWALLIGAVCYVAALWLFRTAHKLLGRNWSITLEIRAKHELIADGPYAFVRHPMYTSFLLMALGQALLLSNWFVGLAGLIGFAAFFLLRVRKEENMMLENFGPAYRSYMQRTKRIVPFIY
jgi:protein-S-isoprenylcysteine O-methyltransferase Ste14